MSRLTLTFWIILAAGCADDASENDASTTDDAAAPDAGDSSVTPHEPPSCEPLGAASIVERYGIVLSTDSFMTCDHEDPVTDAAFTWTAPSSGLYRFSGAGAEESAGTELIEVRHGDCIVDAERDDASTGDAVCIGTRLSEAGDYRSQVIAVEAGETYTVIVEGEASHTVGDGEPEANEIALRIAPALCPGIEQRVAGGLLDIDELPAMIPLDIEVFTRAEDPELRELTCSTARYARQRGVRWTAPATSRYRFEAELAHPLRETFAIALLRDDCMGAELACGQDEARPVASADFEAGETAVVLLESGDGSYEDESVRLRITRE